MHNKQVMIKELFECEGFVKQFFEKYSYPWEILPNINKFILEVIQKGLPGYKEIQKGVIAGKNVNIHPSVHIDGPAVIGSGTCLRIGAFIRGSVIIGENCVVGNSTELKNCILLNNVQIPHYNYVGDSILGNHAHMGAGSVCSNLKNDGRSVVVHGESDYNTGLRKVGAFLGDGADIGCNCVLNPGTVIGKNTFVYPLCSIRGVFAKNCIVKSNNNVIERQIQQ